MSRIPAVRALRRSSPAVAALAAVWAADVALRAWQFWPARRGLGATRYGDAAEYERIARLPVWSLQFFTEHKPFGYPLFLLLLGRDQSAVVWAQLAISIGCWSFLAWVVARRMPRPAAPFAAGSILLLSSAWPVAQWDTLVLTESLTLSLLAALVALGILCLEQPDGRRLAAFAAAALALTSLRDASGAAAALLCLVLAATLVARRPRLAALAALTAVGCVALVVATSSVRRWEILVADQVGKGAAANPAELAYFRAHGMPAVPQLARIVFADTRSPLPAHTFLTDPRLRTLIPWFMAHGRSTYEDYLLTHPAASLATPLERLTTLLGDTGLATYRAPGFRALTGGAGALAYPGEGGHALDLLLVALGLAAVALLRGAAGRELVLPLATAALAVPLTVLIWDGEPSEVARHMLLAGVAARTGALVTGWLAVSALVRQRSAVTAARRRLQPGSAAL